MLKGKKILIGISGSIAAYKIIHLTRLLVKAGADVRIVMSPAAVQFVSPLVLSTLSGNKALVNMFEEDVWANHVMLGRWADLMLIAPLSCNTLGKMANGLCDNLLLSVYLSATCKVICAPAMDEDMWHHPATQKNITLLNERGNVVLAVNSGALASGLTGEGRMQEPEELFLVIKEHFRGKDLDGYKVLITSGPTREAIDPVRFIANHSSGKMGKALAEAFYEQGADVIFITGNTNYYPVYQNIMVVNVTSAEDMYREAFRYFPQCNIAVLAAAVADYTPKVTASKKIKKSEAEFNLPLQRTKDILKELGKQKTSQLLIGFALETNDELDNARKKLEDKNADLIVLNSMRDPGAGFGHDTNKVTILGKNIENISTNTLTKKELSYFIIQIIKEKYDL